MGGMLLGIILYAFNDKNFLGYYLPIQGQSFMEIFIPTLSIIAVIMGFGIIFKKIHFKTTDRGLIFGTVGTIAILNYIIKPFLLN